MITVIIIAFLRVSLLPVILCFSSFFRMCSHQITLDNATIITKTTVFYKIWPSSERQRDPHTEGDIEKETDRQRERGREGGKRVQNKEQNAQL